MRTLRLVAMVLAAAALSALAIACDDEPASAPNPGLPSPTRAVPPPTTTGAAPQQPTATPPVPAGPCTPPLAPHGASPNVFCADSSAMEPAAVLRIVDGDTLDVLVGGSEERVRIFGIDTPERGDRCFGEASDALAVLAGAEVRMVRDARNRDSSGRLLRYLYRPDGLSIDATIIAAGLATAWTRDGVLRDQLVRVEAEARLAGTGCLWN